MGSGMDMLSARSADAAASDGQLLARIARGDQDAVAALYRRLERPLFAFLVKTLRDREAAADVLNETMLDVWRQAGRFEGKSSVATWIYSIAHHKAISWLRKRREVELDEEAANQVADDAPGADSKIAAEDLMHIIARLMERLSVDHRIVLQLAYFQEFSVGQIAEILGLPGEHREDAHVLRPAAPAHPAGGRRHRRGGGMRNEQHPHGPLEPQDVEELLPWYVTGRVSREEARGIEAALKTMPDLADKLAQVQRERDAVARAAETIEPAPPETLQRLLQQVETTRQWRVPKAEPATAGADWLGTSRPPRGVAGRLRHRLRRDRRARCPPLRSRRFPGFRLGGRNQRCGRRRRSRRDVPAHGDGRATSPPCSQRSTR